MATSQTIRDIKSDMKKAMKARNSDRTAALRMLVASLNNAKIDKGRELTDDEVIEVLSKEAKSRKESIDAYHDAGRTQLAEKEEKELELIEQYLPAKLSDEEVEEMVDEIIEETGAESPRDMGQVMGQVMPKVKGRYDGSKVKDMVLEKLQ